MGRSPSADNLLSSSSIDDTFAHSSFPATSSSVSPPTNQNPLMKQISNSRFKWEKNATRLKHDKSNSDIPKRDSPGDTCENSEEEVSVTEKRRVSKRKSISGFSAKGGTDRKVPVIEI